MMVFDERIASLQGAARFEAGRPNPHYPSSSHFTSNPSIPAVAAGVGMKLAVPAANSLGDTWGTASIDGANVNKNSVSEWVQAVSERVDDLVSERDEVRGSLKGGGFCLAP